MSLFDTAEFSSSLFFPRPDRSPPPPGATDAFVTVDGAQLHVRTHPAPDGARMLLLFHGNGEVIADYDDAAAEFAAAGARLVVADYRGYGRSTGTPSLRTAVSDAYAVLAAVPGPVFVMGRSLGSACAAELYAANLPSVEGVILESGSSDLVALGGPGLGRERRALLPRHRHGARR
jgi:alpha-beta hydrolase superfamily lysophospholipase